MPTRSGKRYLVAHLCQKCSTFYSHDVFGHLCSNCAGVIKTTKIPRPEFVARAAEWVKANTMDPDNVKYAAFLRGASRMGTTILYATLKGLREEEGLLLRASHAYKLFCDNGTVRRGHILGAHIGDWWNIRTKSAGGEWPSYVVCYYGDWDSPSVPAMPPRGPRALLSCTETTGLQRCIPQPRNRVLKGGGGGGHK